MIAVHDVMQDKARQALKQAYAPYSKFAVGACIESDEGLYFSGCNEGNASYGLTQCAESSAIAAMISQGHRQINKILIMADTSVLCPPRGACRQRIAEFSNAVTVVRLCNLVGKCQSISFTDLFPFPFDSETLGEK